MSSEPYLGGATQRGSRASLGGAGHHLHHRAAIGAAIGAIVTRSRACRYSAARIACWASLFGMLRRRRGARRAGLLCHAVAPGRGALVCASTLAPYAQKAGNVLRSLVGEGTIPRRVNVRLTLTVTTMCGIVGIVGDLPG